VVFDVQRVQTVGVGVGWGGGQKATATSNVENKPQAASSKLQAASSKLQAASSKQQAACTNLRETPRKQSQKELMGDLQAGKL